ncbi:MAG: HAD family phosphatase [Spirochaetota bacterium]|nr:MAG: HAD family phosphatase [Spirochaetota bacterium]
MRKDIRAILFDLDGLLVPTEELHIKAYNTVFEQFGIILTQEVFNKQMGVSTRENVKRIMKDNKIPPDKYDEILKLRYDIYYDSVKSTPLTFMDGAIECFEYIMEKKLKRGLVTSSIKEHALAVLVNLNKHGNWRVDIFDYFDVLVFGDEIEMSKPNPEIYIKACERLDINPSRCIALEDSQAGVLSAKNAGLYVIAVSQNNTNSYNIKNADIKLKSLREIVQRKLFD